MSKRASRNLCPLCDAPAVAAHAPFCSQGCRDRDLLAWLGEGYRLPGPHASDTQISRDGLDSGESAD
ncbi:DNA gyrase inhibitor YacG [Sphingomonas sp. ac-8]|uniref:DNA gyrase inhibitor YacG n=1 Tax=Sphingomonas sp. ac-8 TaxID=3242977 RepID=UPI003A810E2F